VVGGICLLAFFAIQIIPVNVTGLLLVALGIGLLILEIRCRNRHPDIGGTVSLLVRR
jgi:membrane-bound ClpP family serine protease